MAITANACYNSHTPISLGVSYVFVPVCILSEVHPTTEVIVRILTYDEGKLIKLMDEAGEERHFEYDGENRITVERDCDETAYVINEYDSEGGVIKQQDADTASGSVTFAYDTDGTDTVVTIHDFRE